MAEIVNIASLTIDVDGVTKESVRLKKELDALKKAQKELKDSGEESSEAFVQNEVQIKKLSKAYRDNQNFATSLDKANEDLTETMRVQGKSTQQLRDDRATLNQISKNIIGDTEEEIALREELNGVINEQTEALKEQAPEYIKQKEEIGAYTDGINRADFNLRSLIDKSQEAGGATKLLGGGIKAATKGMLAFTKSALAFIATPVGIILAAIAGAFVLIKNAMDRSEESTTKIKTAFAGFSGILKAFGKILEPIGGFLVDIFAKGLEKVADLFGKINPEIEKSIEANRELVKAELELTKAQRIARRVQLDFQKDAERLRQIRDDESKSIAERQRANTELGALLKKQGEEELALAQRALDVANLRIKLDGETTEALDEREAALTEIADIEERITGQQSEQLVNINSLNKEAAELAKVQAEKASELARLELAEFIDFQKKKIEVNKETNKQLAEDDLNRFNLVAEERKLKAAEDAENALQILEAESLKVFDIERKRLDQQRDAELAAAEETGASVFLINQKYAARKKNLERAVSDAQIDGFGQVFDSYASTLGEQTKVGKAAAVASTLISTYQGAQNAYTSLAGIPVVGVGLGIAAAAAAVVAGLKNVSQIVSTPSTFSKGDLLKGRSHARGGIPFSIGGKLGYEAEGGEAIINKRSTSMFAPLLSAINVAGGGKKFASGDFLGSSSIGLSGSIVDYDVLANSIARANESLPNPVVSVEEINRVDNGVKVVEGLATA